MKKKICRVCDCEPGSIAAEDVFSRYGALVLSKNTIIDDQIKEGLIYQDIDKISVFEIEIGDEPTSGNASIEVFKKSYKATVENFKTLLTELAEGKDLDMDLVNSISDSVYNFVSKHENIVKCLSELKQVDEYTYSHCVNVSIYAVLLSKWLNVKENEKRDIILCGTLHDIGKSKIPLSILNKKGKLTPDEYEIMKQHSTFGYEMLKSMPNISVPIKSAVLMHHERESGIGYPFGVKGDNINYYAKIISVIDVYDALTSERIYKKKSTPFDTFKEFEEMGYAYFDPKILLTFLNNISNYYIGTSVMMSNGEIGEVVYIPPGNLSMPIVKIQDKLIDLSTREDLTIETML